MNQYTVTKYMRKPKFPGELLSKKNAKMNASVKGMKPKGKRGASQVKKLGRTKKTGGFANIAAKAGAKYGSAKAGKKVAGAVFQKMVKARSKGKKA